MGEKLLGHALPLILLTMGNREYALLLSRKVLEHEFPSFLIMTEPDCQTLLTGGRLQASFHNGIQQQQLLHDYI